jgi:hypothetical protein
MGTATMNMKTAEEAALDYASGEPRWPNSMHVQAFSWAHKKRSDRKVSPEFRKRAASVARRLWDAAGRPRNVHG